MVENWRSKKRLLGKWNRFADCHLLKPSKLEEELVSHVKEAQLVSAAID